MTSRDVQASLSFLHWQDLYNLEKPFQIFINIPEDAEDQRDTNLVFKRVCLTIRDVRGLSTELSLDTNGFIYRQHTMRTTDCTDREDVEQSYLSEVEELLKREVEGADRVFFFDWRLRKNTPEIEGTVMDMNDLTTWLRPAVHVHVDQSPAAALKRIQLQLKEEAPQLLRGRVRIINVWRPLIDSVEDWPIAVSDGRTIKRCDLVEADHVRRHYTGSTMYLMPDPQQQFYYMSKQSKNDVLIFKNFDSKRDVDAPSNKHRLLIDEIVAPHASFLHPDATADATPRESIEVRALVFTYLKS
ncbi:MAG: hypothetical protein Q9167_005551 [Letrouitia subvulpina]